MQVAPLLKATALARQAGLVHGFTTRRGGVSTGLRSSLHLVADGEDPEVEENWRRVVHALDPSWTTKQLALLHQVHGCRVISVDKPLGPQKNIGKADAAVTDQPGVVLAIRTADCVPVLLSAPGAVGAAHAGWRGVVSEVVPQTVTALCNLIGAPPDQLVAAVGPHISPAAYEVGDDVIGQLAAQGLQDAIVTLGASRSRHAALGVAVVTQLRRAGVQQVEHLGRCTFLEDNFFSYRRDGPQTGRQAAVIARRP